MLKRIKGYAERRYDRMRARMHLRNVMDYELIGRYCGLLFFPFVIYICVGKMQAYSEGRIHKALIYKDIVDLQNKK